MPLEVQGPRPLSPLERDAVKLVFWDSIDPCDFYLTVLEDIEHTVPGTVATTTDGGGIKIKGPAFTDTDALDINSTRTNVDIFKPANMNYLSRVIHECTHHWQGVHEKYEWRGPGGVATPYGFSWQELQTLKFLREQNQYILEPEKFPEEHHELLKEQHVSAAQVYFVIEWQLRYQPKGSDVNLTSQSPNSEDNVVPVDRFHDIDRYINNSGKGTSRIVKYQKAHESIHNNFGWLIVELRYGWKVVCQGREPFAKATGG